VHTVKTKYNVDCNATTLAMTLTTCRHTNLIADGQLAD